MPPWTVEGAAGDTGRDLVALGKYNERAKAKSSIAATAVPTTAGINHALFGLSGVA
jgi:hypothetical protein